MPVNTHQMGLPLPQSKKRKIEVLVLRNQLWTLIDQMQFEEPTLLRVARVQALVALDANNSPSCVT